MSLADPRLPNEMFDVDSDIARARTLPSDFYTRSDIFALSQEMIFARSWQFLCAASEISNLKPVTILEGSLEEPALLVRDRTGEVRCISNVCTHRGKLLVEEPSKGDLIRCGYHGRRFSLSGKFLSMPEFEGVECFPSSDDDLTPIPIGQWNGFVFASISPAAPLEDFLVDVNGLLAGFPYEHLRFRGTRDYAVDCHWALYCENYLEGFHIPYVHSGLNNEIDYGSYTTELFRFSSIQTARSEGGPDREPPFQNGTEAFYCFIFPNLMLNFYPWGISVNIVKPISPQRTVVSYVTYVSDPGAEGQGAGADLDTVEREDQQIVESVQKGIRSRYYDRGRYSPSRETGTHHFHRLICDFMTEGD